jgi:hypothetical protein
MMRTQPRRQEMEIFAGGSNVCNNTENYWGMSIAAQQEVFSHLDRSKHNVWQPLLDAD